MISLIIAFLISLGWYSPESSDTIEVNHENDNRYGVVITSEVGTRYGTLYYDPITKAFIVLE